MTSIDPAELARLVETSDFATWHTRTYGYAPSDAPADCKEFVRCRREGYSAMAAAITALVAERDAVGKEIEWWGKWWSNPLAQSMLLTLRPMPNITASTKRRRNMSVWSLSIGSTHARPSTASPLWPSHDPAPPRGI